MKVIKWGLAFIGAMSFFLLGIPASYGGISNYDTQPSPAFTYCVTAGYNSQFTTTVPPERCYGNYTDYSAFVHTYTVDYVTFYRDSNLSGWRLAYVGDGTSSNDPCARGQYAYHLPIGWNDQISSSITGDINCSFVGVYKNAGFDTLMYSCGYLADGPCRVNYSEFNANDLISSVSFGNS